MIDVLLPNIYTYIIKSVKIMIKVKSKYFLLLKWFIYTAKHKVKIIETSHGPPVSPEGLFQATPSVEVNEGSIPRYWSKIKIIWVSAMIRINFINRSLSLNIDPIIKKIKYSIYLIGYRILGSPKKFLELYKLLK